MLSISDLKSRWNKEKKHYQGQEVGSGVHKFIRDVMECPELFNLREGSLSKKASERKDEFIQESKTKGGRHADFVIYVNSEIIIPVEVKSLGNINNGAEQLFIYQKDLDKKYGILTDGQEWRFYTETVYREFTIKQILDNPKLFLNFWQKDYILPEHYYLQFFEKTGQQKLIEEVIKVEDNRTMFFEDITEKIEIFRDKMKLEGYLKELQEKERAKKIVELSYAYIIQFILYKTLVDNEFGEFKKDFEQRQTSIYKSLQAKQYKSILGVIDGISEIISKDIYHPFNKEQEFINQKLSQLLHQPENELHDVAPWLEIFVLIKKYNFANVKNEIFGYIYENYLKTLYENTKKGQYFTDPAVVNFMLDQVGYTPEEIKKRLRNKPDENYISINDPSCGSGTFLYSAVDQIITAVPDGSEKQSQKVEELVNNNVYGLDIEEFPLYLAEMNILMRMLPLIINEKYNNPIDKKIKVFQTHDSIAEFQDTKLRYTLSDIEAAYVKSNGQMKLFYDKLKMDYESYMREEDDLKEMKESLGNQKFPRMRFDFVIGNPPYVSYNECSKQGLLSFNWIKESKMKLNDIYGVNLHSIPDHRKKYSPKPNLYAFFIALGLALLKDEGRLCYIIPQTILTAGDLDVLRYHLAKFTTIEKIITFSGKMFIGRGLKQNKPIATSSLIFVVRRIPPDLYRDQVEIIHYKDANDNIEDCLKNILENKKINKKKILQNKLLQNVSNWNFIKQDKKFLDFYENYKKNTDDISIYYNHAVAEYNFKNKFYFDKGLVFPKNAIQKRDKSDENSFNLIKLNKDFYLATILNDNISKEKIKIPHGSQGLEVFEKKHKILWSYMNYDNFYFSDKKIMLNFNFVLISSDNKKEMLYLLALLNSQIIKLIFDVNLRTENEKDILVGIKTIKEMVRIPRITEDNQFVKDEIIKKTEEMLELEGIRLNDLVDFSKVMMQKFDNLFVKDGYLVLEKNKKQMKLKIKNEPEIVEQAVKRSIVENNKLKLDDKEQIILSELKELMVIDFEKQKELRNYIDDLVFALYFNVLIKEVDLGQTEKIKKMCVESKFYKVPSS